MTRQRMMNISLDGRFLAVIVTPNLSLSHSLSLSLNFFLHLQTGSDPDQIRMKFRK